MKYALDVCLVAFIASTLALSSAAQSPALQQGISVEMVPTHSASAMPDADDQNAFIVTVTENGSVYLGINPISVDELAEKARVTPLKRGSAIYIKADARTPYSAVLPVLKATGGGVIPQVLLTSQPAATESGTVPPRGLDVSYGSTSPSGTVATLVQLPPSAQPDPVLKVNHDKVLQSALEATLQRHFQKGDNKLVQLTADPHLPFAQVVHVIDSCHAAGARVHLAEAER